MIHEITMDGRGAIRARFCFFSQEELRPTIPNGVLCDRNKGYSASSSVRASLCDSFVRLDQHVTDHKLP